MQVRILHQGLTADGRIFDEGDEIETSNPNLIAYALGYRQLRNSRKTRGGYRIAGDHRAAEPVGQPTPDEEAIAATLPSGEVPVGIWTRPPPPSRDVTIAEASLSKLADAVSERIVGAVADALDEEAGDAPRKRGRPRKEPVEA